MKELQTNLRRSMILAVIVAILGGAMIGFVVGYKVRGVTCIKANHHDAQ